MAKILWAVLAVALLAVAGMFFYNEGSLTGFVGKGNTKTSLGDNNTTSFLSSGIAYGSNIDALDLQNETSWKPDYVLIWAGPWIETDPYGWETFNGWLDKARAEGSTPVILWYYWGNDTTPASITTGVGGKSIENWMDMTSTIGDSISDIMGSKGAIVVLEPEFNKYGTEEWLEFNQYLIQATDVLQDKNSNIKVAIGFGNWDNEKWKNFEDAVKNADLVGYQGVARLPDNKAEDFGTVVENSIAASEYLQRSFPGKPIIWYDFAVASEPGTEQQQHDAVKAVFDNAASLESAGTRIVIYRHLKDVTQFNTPVDQHWGLISSDGEKKMAYTPWIEGVKAGKVATV